MRWRETFFAKPDPALAEAFAQEIIWDNLNRARLLNALAMVLAIVLLLLQDFLLWRSGGWLLTPALRDWLWLHIALLGASLIAALILRSRRRSGPADTRPSDGLAVQLLAVGFLVVLLINSLVQQHITGQISASLVGIGVYASCFYSSPRTSLLVIGGAASALTLTLPLTQHNPVMVTNHVIVTGIFAFIFWFVSRLVYSLRAQDFNQLNTIATQARSLEHANAELRKANALKTELVSIAAHDLRDPLNAIGGLTHELENELPADSPARELVNGIGESARRISRLVENLLTDAETETRGLKLDREPADLVRLVDDVVSDYRWLAGSKRVQLHCTTPDELFVSVDARKFRQLLENLLSNAIKYSRPEHLVTVTLQAGTDSGARLSVHDQGAGLLPEDQPRLFGKFARLSARPTQGESTAGLGLAIVKAIAEAHGGRVWAESPGRNQGATFFVELP